MSNPLQTDTLLSITALILIVMLGGLNMANSEEQTPEQAATPQPAAEATTEEATTESRAKAGETSKDWDLVDWKSKLSPLQCQVTREGATERPFHNEFWDNKRQGEYRCVCCDLPLYKSETKYESGSGWPSFYKPINDKAISERQDLSHGMVRTEIRCSRCKAHLGHVFPDGPKPTGLRYCMNSASMRFLTLDELAEEEQKQPASTEATKTE